MVNTAVWEQIRDHLQAIPIAELTDRDVWPVGATQQGIATAVGVSRSHAALEMKRLEVKGEVRRFLVHVEGAPKRHLTYRWEKNGAVKVVSNGKDPIRVYMEGKVRNMHVVVARCPNCGKDVHAIIREGVP